MRKGYVKDSKPKKGKPRPPAKEDKDPTTYIKESGLDRDILNSESSKNKP